MEKLISAYRRMLRQGNHALTVIVGWYSLMPGGERPIS
ncbi:hypothetical protein ACLADA_004129, partial [Escherichia coli]